MAVSFSYYTDNFKGKLIPEADFAACEQRASALVDMITQGKSRNSTLDCVKMAVCAAAEICCTEQNGGAKKSETVGEYSVSYADCESSGLCSRLRRAIAPYLLQTGMMSRSC